ncbi:hypothetical protein BIW11_12200 [Tropilaelaps mercedesae]|uniref:Uncharacterized protein n=1 Tax=Tropilaelaps mercedesae TaxID=418985 RepID=A0A1V9X7H1_9ACAR|nr:hypothetical protein BIW11_12200 [Tropilaelaps mercedesae]
MAASAVSCNMDDPWRMSEFADATIQEEEQSQLAGFEDNFEPLGWTSCRPAAIETQEQSDRSSRFEMPDSQQYLASLEAKLRRLKVSKKNEKDEARRMVSELRLHKEGRWENAIEDVMPIGFSADALRDDPCAVPFIVRMLYPERSALTAEELQKLVDNDCLTALVNLEGDPVTLNHETTDSSQSSSPQSEKR